MDYFLRRDAKCYKLEQDSIEMAKKIDLYKQNEALYKQNEFDYKSQVLANKTLANNYKQTAVEFQQKYTSQKSKTKVIGGIAIGSLTVNLIFIAGIIVLIK